GRRLRSAALLTPNGRGSAPAGPHTLWTCRMTAARPVTAARQHGRSEPACQFTSAMGSSVMKATPVASLLFALFIRVIPAHAFDTFVSRTGSDANPCTQASPCATFERAVSQTTEFGMIRCLDSGNFAPGTFLIDRSLTIDCTGIGGLLGGGVLLANNANLQVTLRGLIIDGRGTSAIGVFYGGTS